MIVQASLAVYPLGQQNFDAVHRAIEALDAAHVTVTRGSMNTTIVGDEPAVFAALRDAFSAAAKLGGTVLTVTVSNACPL